MLFQFPASQKNDGPTAPRRTTASGSSASTKDPDRFYCPYEGCNRSFAELWRLKVHYRAAPDVRGSGKERGHGAELEECPKCGAELKPGRHHVGCAAGKHALAQQERRRTLKGRKRSGCRGSSASVVKTVATMQAEEAAEVQTTTAVGVPVSWMSLDFNQFFLPVEQRPIPVDADYGELMPESESVQSWVYGKQGELPTMAMAQVGVDSDFGMDFTKFLNSDDGFDTGSHLRSIKEETIQTGTDFDSTRDFFFEDTAFKEDGLDKYLSSEYGAVDDDDGEDMSDLTGRKRERRRSSLEQRKEKRKGQNKSSQRTESTATSTTTTSSLTSVIAPRSVEIPPLTKNEQMSHLLGETLPDSITGNAENGINPLELAFGGRDLQEPPFLPSEHNELSSLVQTLNDCELRHEDQAYLQPQSSHYEHPADVYQYTSDSVYHRQQHRSR